MSAMLIARIKHASQFQDLKSKKKVLKKNSSQDFNGQVSTVLAPLTFRTASISWVNLEMFTKGKGLCLS